MKYETEYGLPVLRFGLGILFIGMGILKLSNTNGVVSMLNTIGFPVPAFWAWLLLLTELIFGAAVLVGWKLKHTTVPLIILMIIAILTVAIKQPQQFLKDFSILMGLITLMLAGPGKWALGIKKQ